MKKRTVSMRTQRKRLFKKSLSKMIVLKKLSTKETKEV